MARILHIETATQVCSVALAIDGKVAQIRESREKNSHSATAAVFVSEVITSSGLTFSQLDAVCVSKGPGSYTGLRIGVSTAKGICYALGKPLIAISTLQSMAAGMESQGTPSLLLCPMIDARRMEVYNALYDNGLKPVREIRAEIITAGSFAAELEQHEIWFFGNGAGKCKSLLGHHPNARFIDGFELSAAYMAGPAEEKFSRSIFEDTVYFEPYYLKDFIPGIPKVKGLRF